MTEEESQPQESDTLGFLADAWQASWVPPFRGEIWEYARTIDLQAGYAVKGRFDISTLRHLQDPLLAIKDPSVRLVSILGAVQTTKSLLLDVTVPYLIENDPGDILWLFEDDPKSRLYAETRSMPMIRSIPRIAGMMQDIDRHDKTKTKIKFGYCNLVMAGLNLGNVQSISYRYVFADEAWMARANGLLRQAIYRTRQYPDTKKVIIMGQGGWEGEDHDKIHKETDMRELKWACPSCGGFQGFELSTLRDDSFPVESLRGTYAGLSWDKNDETCVDNKWNFEKAGRTAHIRCYHCDYRIEDTQENRQKMADSYRYESTNPSAQAGYVGFRWPALASTRISFADQVIKYLMAKTAKDQQGYNLPMQEFYQKDLAINWADEILDDNRKVKIESYDYKSAWADEAYRPMIVDCQKDLKLFWFTVFAVSKAGESRELARGSAESFDELAEIQVKNGVKDQHFFIDCGYEMTQVLRECRKRGHVATILVAGRPKKVWRCWTGLKGSGSDTFPHRQRGTDQKDYRIYSERKFYNVDIGTAGHGARAPWYEWSNLACKDLLRARRDQEPGTPKMLSLPETVPETDQLSYFSQMRSERRHEEFRSGKKCAVWEPTKAKRPNHFWDIGAMLMAFMAITGIIGGGDEDQDGSSG